LIAESFWQPQVWRTQYCDEKEQRQLMDVLVSRPPFRWDGPGSTPPTKVATFEKGIRCAHANALKSGPVPI